MVLAILRIVALVSTFVFSVVVLGLTAHFTSTTNTYIAVTYNFAALALASASISIVSIPVMLIVDFVRTGAFTSMVVVELVWLSVIWVLWLSTAADTASFFSVFFNSSCGYIDQIVNTACHEVQALEAFAFLTWLILLAYTITLLVYAIIGSSRGHKTWTSTVKQGNFLAPAGQTGGVQQPQYQQGQPAMPPMHQYPPPNPSPQSYPAPGAGYPAPGQGYPAPGTPPQGYTTPSPGPHYQGSQGTQGPAYV
jgi:hypothetical protein